MLGFRSLQLSLTNKWISGIQEDCWRPDGAAIRPFLGMISGSCLHKESYLTLVCPVQCSTPGNAFHKEVHLFVSDNCSNLLLVIDWCPKRDFKKTERCDQKQGLIRIFFASSIISYCLCSTQGQSQRLIYKQELKKRRVTVVEAIHEGAMVWSVSDFICYMAEWEDAGGAEITKQP